MSECVGCTYASGYIFMNVSDEQMAGKLPQNVFM